MPIKALCGLPRNGKSYNAIKEILLFALEQGRTCVINIPVFEEEIRKKVQTGIIIYFDSKEPLKPVLDQSGEVVDYQFDEQFFNDEERFPDGSVFILDEVADYWPSGLKAEKMHIDNRKFFSMHGHKVGFDGFTNEIYLIVQDLTMVCGFVRGLVEETWIVTKLKKLNLKGMYQVDVWPKSRSTAKTGGKPDNSWTRAYDKSIYKMYKSHTHSSNSAAGVEQDIRSSSPLPKILVTLGIWSVVFFFAGKLMLSSLGMTPAMLFGSSSEPEQVEPPEVKKRNTSSTQLAAPKEVGKPNNFLEPDRKEKLSIVGLLSWSETNYKYAFTDDKGNYLTSNGLTEQGYEITPISNCQANIKDPIGNMITVRCSLNSSSKGDA